MDSPFADKVGVSRKKLNLIEVIQMVRKLSKRPKPNLGRSIAKNISAND